MVSRVSSSRITIYHHNRPDDHHRRCHQQCPAEMMTALTSNCWRSWQRAAATPCAPRLGGASPHYSSVYTHLTPDSGGLFPWVILLGLDYISGGFYSFLISSTDWGLLPFNFPDSAHCQNAEIKQISSLWKPSQIFWTSTHLQWESTQ